MNQTPDQDTLENAIEYMRHHYEDDGGPVSADDLMQVPPLPFWIKHDIEQAYRRGFTHGLAEAVEMLDSLKDGGFSRISECRNIIDGFNIGPCYRWRYTVWKDLASGEFQKWHSHPKLKHESWWDIRAKVLARDRECVYCGSKTRLQADHIQSVACGGLPTMENLQTLCKKCNMKKAAL